MKFVVNENKLPDYIMELLFDPETSGGLLMSVSAKVSDKLLSQLIKAGYQYSAIIGEVIEKPTGRIILI
jgi:selenide,water dikinase